MQVTILSAENGNQFVKTSVCHYVPTKTKQNTSRGIVLYSPYLIQNHNTSAPFQCLSAWHFLEVPGTKTLKGVLVLLFCLVCH